MYVLLINRELSTYRIRRMILTCNLEFPLMEEGAPVSSTDLRCNPKYKKKMTSKIPTVVVLR